MDMKYTVCCGSDAGSCVYENGRVSFTANADNDNAYFSVQFNFPDGSDFDKLKINTVGSLFANAQNKHSAPGICTHSGLGVYRLYEYTGDAAYLDLIRNSIMSPFQLYMTGGAKLLSYKSYIVNNNPAAIATQYQSKRPDYVKAMNSAIEKFNALED